jgi:hypothetical protein
MRYAKGLTAVLVVTTSAAAHPSRGILVDCSRGNSLQRVVASVPADSVVKVKAPAPDR